MSKVIRLKQKTPEWKKWRETGIGASDAPVIMEKSPWSTPYRLYIEKTTGQSFFKENGATLKGRVLEDKARKSAEKKLNKVFSTKCYQHEKYPWMLASLDGISKEGEILEIKCPYKPEDPNSDHQLAREGKIPEKYHPQLQHQLEVTGAKKGYYYSFDGSDGVVVPFERDEVFIKELIEKEKIFWDCVKNLNPPKFTDKDYRVIDEKHPCEKADKVIALRKVIEEAKKELNPLEEELKNCYAHDMSAIIGKLKITRFTKKGPINYHVVPELKGVDLEPYRKASSIAFRLSEIHACI